jgi:hypothetical protein
LSILILSRFARNRHFDGALLEKHFQTRCNIRARIKLHLLVDVDVIKFSIDRVTAFHFETDTRFIWKPVLSGDSLTHIYNRAFGIIGQDGVAVLSHGTHVVGSRGSRASALQLLTALGAESPESLLLGQQRGSESGQLSTSAQEPLNGQLGRSYAVLP